MLIHIRGPAALLIAVAMVMALGVLPLAAGGAGFSGNDVAITSPAAVGGLVASDVASLGNPADNPVLTGATTPRPSTLAVLPPPLEFAISAANTGPPSMIILSTSGQGITVNTALVSTEASATKEVVAISAHEGLTAHLSLTTGSGTSAAPAAI